LRFGLRTILIIVLGILISFTARLVSDAVHVPGFYDLTGIYFSILVLGTLPSLAVAILAPLALSIYYVIYLPAALIYVIIGVLFFVIRRKAFRYMYVFAVVFAFIYALLWFVLYGVISNTLMYMRLFIGMRGFWILVADALISFLVAYVAYLAVGKRLSTCSTKWLLVGVVALLIVMSASWGYVSVNEWGITKGFTDHDWLKRFHTKMDFVWLPLGEKGINNYYYPHDRFERSSPGYQVWIGMYWVQGYRDPKDLGLVAEFAIWDQNFWLGIHGCKEPYTYVDLVENITEMEFNGYKAYLMYGGMVSRSDVEPYEEVVLRGFFITFYDPVRDRTAIVYACSTEENLNKMISKLWEVVNSWNLRK